MTTMLASAPPRIRSAAIDQIHVTHCLHGEGRYQNAGFSVLGSSTDEMLLHRFALDYPQYQLPAGMQEQAAGDAPRRLALVRIPGGKLALIHSVPLQEQARGRANNFYSQVLVLPSVKPHEALATWSSPDWVTHCDPDIGNDCLPHSQLPAAGNINDDLVTAFLSSELPADEQELAVLVCPPRLAADSDRRRDLVRLVLRGCRLSLSAPATEPRWQFFIQGEPGLIALLLYASVRLLPEAMAARLTFSTYEHARRDLKTYMHAHVVGTYIADQEAGLPEEFFTSRGYALDTFKHAYSPELEQGFEAELEEWLDLAARGDWAMVDKIHGILGSKNAAVVSLEDARRVSDFSSALTSGKATPEDLLSARQASWGPAVLDKHRDKIWPLVRDAALNNAKVREAFADVFKDHLPELERRAALAIRRTGPGDWQPHWQMVALAQAADTHALWDTFQRVLPPPPHTPAMRIALLKALHDIQLPSQRKRLRFHPLLRGCGAQDLDQFAKSDLDLEWFVWAINYALLEPEHRAAAVRQLHEGGDVLIGAFWEQFKFLKNEEQRRAVLSPLFPAGEEGRKFFGRSLKNGCRMRMETLEWLLDSLGAMTREWTEFWSAGDHLSQLLEVVRTAEGESSTIWDRLCAQIGAEVLVPGDGYQRTLLLELGAVKDRSPHVLPEKVGQAIEDWMVLHEHFEKATTVPAAERPALMEACGRRRLDPIDLMARYFQHYVQPRGQQKEVLDDFAGFFHNFCPSGEEYQDYNCRLVWWIRVTDTCNDEPQRVLYQRFYLEHFVPQTFRWRLSEETHKTGKLLDDVHDCVLKPTEGNLPADAAWATVLDSLFQLSGVSATALQAGELPVKKVWHRFLWMLPAIAGAVAIIFLFGKSATLLPRLTSFAPFGIAIFVLAECITLHSLALAVRSLQLPAEDRNSLSSSLLKELLAGLAVGVVCGAILLGVAMGTGVTMKFGIYMAGSAAAGMCLSALIGMIMPRLLEKLSAGKWIAPAQMALPSAGLVSVLLYFCVCKFLLA